MKIRILTYNIHKGFNTFGNQFVLSQIKESVQATAADILFLQEVVGENTEHAKNVKNWPTQPQFEFLADTVWKHFSYGKNAVFPVRHHGNAILSKFPISFEENLNISNNKLERRGLLHCVVDIKNGKRKIHLFNTHIDLLASGRKKQILKIRNRIESHTKKDDVLIFTGDFNDWSHKISPLLEDSLLNLKEAHTAIHGAPAKTFPCFLPVLSLDRVYYRGLRPLRCETLPWTELSDHLSLLEEMEPTEK